MRHLARGRDEITDPAKPAPLAPGDIVYLRGVVMQVPGGPAGKNVLVNLLGPGGAMIPFVTPKEGSHIERVGPAEG